MLESLQGRGESRCWREKSYANVNNTDILALFRREKIKKKARSDHQIDINST